MKNRHTIYGTFFKTDTQFMAHSSKQTQFLTHCPKQTHNLWHIFQNRHTIYGTFSKTDTIYGSFSKTHIIYGTFSKTDTQFVVQDGSNMTGQTVTCLHTISPGHISTTLYILENRHTIYDSFFKTDTQFMVHFPNHTHDLWQNFLCGKRSCTVNPINGQHHKYLSCKLTWRHYRHLKAP